MSQPEQLSAALVAALSEMPNVRKTGTGNYGKHAELHEIIEVVRDVLKRHDLAFLQDVSPLADGRIGITTILVHKSGERLATGPLPLAAPTDPQKVGSAITYGRRYALMATLGLAAEDDDGQAASQAVKPKPADPGPSKRSLSLYAECQKAPDDVKNELRAFANENQRKVSVAEFEADPAWADMVRAFLKNATTKESK